MHTGPAVPAVYVVVVSVSRLPSAASARLIVCTIWLPVVPYLDGTLHEAGHAVVPLSASVSCEGCVRLVGIHDGTLKAATCVFPWSPRRTMLRIGAAPAR